jgi:hypothetical protein
MTHAEFVAAYREGRVRVGIQRKTAARFVSARVLLPLVLLPVLGLGDALASGAMRLIEPDVTRKEAQA